MASFDYAAVLAKVQELLVRFGDPFTLVSYNATPGDPTKPWNGPADPRVGSTTATMQAVQVDPFEATLLGLAAKVEDLMQRAEKILIISPDGTTDVRAFEEVNAPDGPYKIGMVHELNPTGSLTLLWFVELKR